MTAKEKLVEKLAGKLRTAGAMLEYVPGIRTYEDYAKFLIDEGVTVQEWISVEERLPEEGEHILACYSDGWICDQYTPFDDGVAHWMPLPPPPKGE